MIFLYIYTHNISLNKYIYIYVYINNKLLTIFFIPCNDSKGGQECSDAPTHRTHKYEAVPTFQNPGLTQSGQSKLFRASKKKHPPCTRPARRVPRVASKRGVASQARCSTPWAAPKASPHSLGCTFWSRTRRPDGVLRCWGRSTFEAQRSTV